MGRAFKIFIFCMFVFSQNIFASQKLNGEHIYLKYKCYACHGLKGERPALGESKIIGGWSKDRVISALQGYKDGTYGRRLKKSMKAQAKELDKSKIEAVAKYISNL